MNKKALTRVLSSISIALMLSGCAEMSANQQAHTAAVGGIGALLGGIIGCIATGPFCPAGAVAGAALMGGLVVGAKTSQYNRFNQCREEGNSYEYCNALTRGR